MTEKKEDDKPTVDHLESNDPATIEEDIDAQKRLDVSRIDKDVLKYAGTEAVYIDEATNKRLRNKINKRILPIIVITYLVQGLDKGTMSFASIMGLREDTNLVGQQYSWLTTCVYLAMLVSEYPTNWLIQRLPIAKYLSFCVFGWGATLACQAACHNFGGLLACRIFLGLFETCCQPIFLICTSMWYKRSEQAMIITMWYGMNGINAIVGGLLAYCFSLITGAALESWRILFMTYGCITCAFAVFTLYWMPDSPMKAKCFSEEDKKLMVERVRENQTGLQNKTFRWYQFREAMLDPQIWCYAFVQMLTCIGSGGTGAFLNIIINSIGFTVLQTQLLSIIQGAFVCFLLLSSAWLSRKFKTMNTYIMFGYQLFSIAAAVILITVPFDGTTKTQAPLLFAMYLSMSFWGSQNVSMSLLSRNICGRTKQSVAVALQFMAAAAGNAIGPQTFREEEEPRYFTAFAVQLACYCVVAAVCIFLRFWLIMYNKKKEKQLADGEQSEDLALEHAFEDKTDHENATFKYHY